MGALRPSECLRRRSGCLTSSCTKSKSCMPPHTSVTLGRQGQLMHTRLVSVTSFPPTPHPSQCGRSLRGFPHDQGHCAVGWNHNVDPAGQLQVLVHHGRHLLPLRQAELLHEVWLLDLRWEHGGPGAGGSLRGPERLLRQRGVGDPQRHGSKGEQEGWGVLVPVCDLLLHPQEAAPLLHPLPHHPVPRPLLSDCASVLFAVGRRRETVAFHIRAGVPHCVPAGHRRNHPLFLKGRRPRGGVLNPKS